MKFLTAIGFSLSFLFQAPSFCANVSHHIEEDAVFLDGKRYAKIYVDPDTVHIYRDSISIDFEDGVVTASSIYSDGEGVFFLASLDHAWHCEWCDFPSNLETLGCCFNCGHPQN